MNILPYKLKTTKEQLTSRAGLVIIAQIMKQVEDNGKNKQLFGELKRVKKEYGSMLNREGN